MCKELIYPILLPSKKRLSSIFIKALIFHERAGLNKNLSSLGYRDHKVSIVVSILNQSNGNIFFYIITFHNSELLFQTAV
jgi:hypothetical protein